MMNIEFILANDEKKPFPVVPVVHSGNVLTLKRLLGLFQGSGLLRALGVPSQVPGQRSCPVT